MAESSKKSVVLGVTGGIAAYKAAELVRELARNGIEVQVVMTEAAGSLVAPATFQALSGKPVYTDLWDARVADTMPHIELSRGKDALVVAPATADFIAKLAQGLADDLLSTLCLARECPLIVAPAMNRQMWEKPGRRRTIEPLRRGRAAGLPAPPFCVGCAAETGNLPQPAEAKRRSKKVPLLAANLAQRA